MNINEAVHQGFFFLRPARHPAKQSAISQRPEPVSQSGGQYLDSQSAISGQPVSQSGSWYLDNQSAISGPSQSVSQAVST